MKANNEYKPTKEAFNCTRIVTDTRCALPAHIVAHSFTNLRPKLGRLCSHASFKSFRMFSLVLYTFYLNDELTELKAHCRTNESANGGFFRTFSMRCR